MLNMVILTANLKKKSTFKTSLERKVLKIKFQQGDEKDHLKKLD